MIVVLVDFDDRPFVDGNALRQHFQDLFFSPSDLTGGRHSVRQYFTAVSNGLVEITGKVVGPYRLPSDLSDYAHGESGLGTSQPNARTMAKDAVDAADPHVDFSPFDNDGDGFVDAFVVVHAGRGAEETGSTGDIWSHKWVLANGAAAVDSTKIYAYLTVPEDARLGVCAHELGHLLFGFPDLYDTDGTSEGVGNWCLMGGGSWNGGGDNPAHPSAWCKAQQGWVTVIRQASNSTVDIADVKDAHRVYRLWKDGAPGREYFLVENRQRTGFDADLPHEGLLIWHVDEAIPDNTNELHPKVKLMQADAKEDLEDATNRGDGGDPYPGSETKRAFTRVTSPSSMSYGGVDTCVAVTSIADSAPIMRTHLAVRCGPRKPVLKESHKEVKDGLKEFKEFKDKESMKEKEVRKDYIGDKPIKELNEPKPWIEKPLGDKRPEKPITDKAVSYDKPPSSEKGGEKLVEGGLADRSHVAEESLGALLARIMQRIAAVESVLSEGLSPLIGREMRPDLTESALYEEQDWVGGDSDIDDKRNFDS